MSEYEKIRQKNIAERQRKFQELQLNEAKTRLSDSLNLAPAAKKARANTSYRGLAVKKEKEQSNEPVRKSLRLQNIEAETGLKLPEKEPTLLHWTPPVCKFVLLFFHTFKLAIANFAGRTPDAAVQDLGPRRGDEERRGRR